VDSGPKSTLFVCTTAYGSRLWKSLHSISSSQAQFFNSKKMSISINYSALKKDEEEEDSLLHIGLAYVTIMQA
jgi:hypothetical protein